MGDVVQPDATSPPGELRVLTRGRTGTGSAYRRRAWDLGQLATHALLMGACVVALAPVVLIVINSMKSRESIFGRPFDLPIGRSFDLAG